MHTISIPCHACGHDNPADIFHCEKCQTLIHVNLQPVGTTQQLSPLDKAQTEEDRLLMEAHLVV
ncbi:MAG: hypothetical protein WBP93_14575, partial [Pyrinomonadaceae bacterium]